MIIYINNEKVQTDDILKIETNLVPKKYHAYYYCPLKNTELKNDELCNNQWCGSTYYIINYIMKDGSIIEEKLNNEKNIIERISKILNCDNELDELNKKIDQITYELDIDGTSKLDIINDKIDKFIDNNNNNDKVDDIASDINTIISALNINSYRNNYIDQIITSLDNMNDKFNEVNTKLQEVQESNEQTMGILINLPPSCGPNYIEAS